ncbi:MAG: azurin [Bacteroidota bacterium]
MKPFIILCWAIVFLAACGGSSDQKNTANDQKPEAVSPLIEGAELVKLVINGDDLMRYDKKELRVNAGTNVEITLNHIGEAPLLVMGHNLVILKQGVDLAEFAQRAALASDRQYIPQGDEVIAHTKMLGGGESTTITFGAPAKGSYDFLCSFPGHSGLMQGKFIVE